MSNAFCCDWPGSALPWLSGIVLGLGGTVFLLGGVPVALDGTANVVQLGALDEVLKVPGEGDKKKDISKAKAYELMASCNDEVIKHLCFWFVVMMRSWGCFQTTLGIALWVCIYNIPLPDRYPVHFIYGFLDLAVGLVEAQTAFALQFGVDAVAKFGGTHSTSSTAPEGSAGFPRPKMMGSFITHMTLFLFNVLLGVACLLQNY